MPVVKHQLTDKLRTHTLCVFSEIPEYVHIIRSQMTKDVLHKPKIDILHKYDPLGKSQGALAQGKVYIRGCRVSALFLLERCVRKDCL